MASTKIEDSSFSNFYTRKDVNIHFQNLNPATLETISPGIFSSTVQKAPAKIVMFPGIAVIVVVVVGRIIARDSVRQVEEFVREHVLESPKNQPQSFLSYPLGLPPRRVPGKGVELIQPDGVQVRYRLLLSGAEEDSFFLKLSAEATVCPDVNAVFNLDDSNDIEEYYRGVYKRLVEVCSGQLTINDLSDGQRLTIRSLALWALIFPQSVQAKVLKRLIRKHMTWIRHSHAHDLTFEDGEFCASMIVFASLYPALLVFLLTVEFSPDIFDDQSFQDLRDNRSPLSAFFDHLLRIHIVKHFANTSSGIGYQMGFLLALYGDGNNSSSVPFRYDQGEFLNSIRPLYSDTILEDDLLPCLQTALCELQQLTALLEEEAVLPSAYANEFLKSPSHLSRFTDAFSQLPRKCLIESHALSSRSREVLFPLTDLMMLPFFIPDDRLEEFAKVMRILQKHKIICEPGLKPFFDYHRNSPSWETMKNIVQHLCWEDPKEMTFNANIPSYPSIILDITKIILCDQVLDFPSFYVELCSIIFMFERIVVVKPFRPWTGNIKTISSDESLMGFFAEFFFRPPLVYDFVNHAQTLMDTDSARNASLDNLLYGIFSIGFRTKAAGFEYLIKPIVEHGDFFEALFRPASSLRSNVSMLMQDVFGACKRLVEKMQAGTVLTNKYHFQPSVMAAFNKGKRPFSDQEYANLIELALTLKTTEDLSGKMDQMDRVFKEIPSKDFRRSLFETMRQKLLTLAAEKSPELDAVSMGDIAAILQFALQAISTVRGRRVATSRLKELLSSYTDTQAPSKWLELVKASIAIAFFLKYLTSENLDKAYEKLRSENSASDFVCERITTVQVLILDRPLVEKSLLETLLADDSAHDRILDQFSGSCVDRNMVEGGEKYRLAMKFLSKIWMENRLRLVGICMPPRNTQLITSLLAVDWILRRDASGESSKVMLAKVGTGEGKSLIIAMIAIYLARILGRQKKVHIMVNNIGLLRRDFDVFKDMFEHAELQPLTCGISDFDKDIVYCLRRDLEGYYQREVLRGNRPLDESILIVDEVDALIVDERSTQSYVTVDQEWSPAVLTAFEAISRKSSRPDSVPETIWIECQSAAREAESMMANTSTRKFASAKGQYYLTDTRGRIQENSYLLSLEYVRYKKTSGYQPVYRSNFFVNSFLHQMQQYDAIIGLSGSLGSPAEQEYLRDQFHVWTINVPPFLSTCDDAVVQASICKGVEVLESKAQQWKRVVQLALALSKNVPVLVIGGVNSDAWSLWKSADRERRANSDKWQLLLERDETGNVMEWQDLVGSATAVNPGTAEYRITVTDYFGGRGLDYRVLESKTNDYDGMAVICCTIPDSEREWVQWIGRTARNDNRGQYFVIMSKEDEILRNKEQTFLSSHAKQPPEPPNSFEKSLVDVLLADRDKGVEKKLAEMKESNAEGVRKAKVCDLFYQKEENRRTASSSWPRNARDARLRTFLRQTASKEDCATFCREVIEEEVIFD